MAQNARRIYNPLTPLTKGEFSKERNAHSARRKAQKTKLKAYLVITQFMKQNHGSLFTEAEVEA